MEGEMNKRIRCQSPGFFEIASRHITGSRSLKLMAALILCLGVTVWAQIPNVPFAPSGAGQLPPGKTVSSSQSTLPMNALALKQRMRQAPALTGEQRSAAAARTAAATANSVQYSYAYINIPNSPFIQPNAINNAGLVVGWYLDSSNNYHGFLWQNGTIQYVDYPGALQTSLDGVNNRGQIIGEFLDASFIVHVATYSPASSAWSDLPAIPGGWQGYVQSAVSLNDEGEALGCAVSSSGLAQLTWIWHPDRQAYSYLTSAAAGPGLTCGEALNDFQTVVGQMGTAYDDNPPLLFLGDSLTGYPIVPLPPNLQGGILLAPFGLNNRGTIAGTIFSLSDGSVSAFLRDRDGVFSIVNDTAWPQTYLTGVNDFGVAVGDVYDPTTGLNPGIVAYPQGWSASLQHAQ
jgi:probable HAF family extracellular repeat protein